MFMLSYIYVTGSVARDIESFRLGLTDAVEYLLCRIDTVEDNE